MANEVEIVVSSKSRGDAIKQANKDVANLGQGFVGFDGKVRSANEQMLSLNKSIIRTRDEISTLRTYLSGGKGDTSILGDISKEEQKLKRLTKQFTAMAGDAGREGGEIFTFGFMKTFQSMPPHMQAGIVAGVTGAAAIGAPVLAAALSSAVALGLGAGGLAAGIAIAASSSEVQSAWTGFADGAKEALNEAAGSIEQSLVRGAYTAQSAFNEVLPDIQRSFDILAPTLDNLFEGAAGGAEAFGDHLEGIFTNVAPYIDTVADSLPAIGDALGYMGEELSGNESALQFFQDLMAELPGDIMFVVDTISLLADGYGVWRDSMLLLGAAFAAMDGDMATAKELWGAMDEGPRKASESTDHASGSIREVAAATREAADEANYWADAFDRIYGKLSGIKDASLAFNESLLGMNETVKQNGASLDEHTQKGIDNNQMLLGSIDKIAQWRKANDDGSYSAENLAGKVEVMREAFVNAAVDAGFNRDKVEAMSRELLGVPPVTSSTTNVETGTALARIGGLENRLDAIDGKTASTYVYNNVITRFSTVGQPTARSGPGGFAAAFAHGGNVGSAATGGARGNVVEVGEQGPELVRLPFGSSVHSNPDSRRMAAGGALGGGSDGVMELRLVPVGLGQGLVAEILKVVVKAMRTDQSFRLAVQEAVSP